MSQQHINTYQTEIANLRAVSGTVNESTLREAFKDLLKRWGRSLDLTLVPEHHIHLAKSYISVDAALIDQVRLPHGYWEAKDEKDNLADEISAKTSKGYPTTNIIYEDTKTCVLIQNGVEVERSKLQNDADGLLHLLESFFAYERPEISEFRSAAKQFYVDLPNILVALRAAISEAEQSNIDYREAAKSFLEHAKAAINPSVVKEDVREMLIQHILTAEIFSRVFDNAEYHHENNIAKLLYNLERKFFTGDLRARTAKILKPYYAAIRRAADSLNSRTEKQDFLKGLYESFYQVYNPKAADRLGVVYTPTDIVRFIIRSTDWLCEKHFGKNLIDSNVEILDPATGTGTFIVELLEHFSGNKKKLAYKYASELHANEVAILPYYVANLNIEATYAALTGKYVSFPGLVFVDTLDNTAALGKYSGHQSSLFGGFSDENGARIKRQNDRVISVIMGNPPYNANQKNENDNNKNRTYPRIDAHIKQTYVKQSVAKKPKAYDMYARFYRWATDRMREDGIISFITNRSFIYAKTYDGFRKLLLEDFAEIWVVDMGGDWKQPGDGGGENVFGISTGVAMCFLVKKGSKGAKVVHYGAISSECSAEDKLALLNIDSLAQLADTTVKPDAKHNWINLSNSDFDSFIPMISERTKKARTPTTIDAIFHTYTNGINTARDAWVYGRTKSEIAEKIEHFMSVYEKPIKKSVYPVSIKWSRNLKQKLISGAIDSPIGTVYTDVNYRPFCKRLLYTSKLLIDEPAGLASIFPPKSDNYSITIPDTGGRASYCAFAASGPIDFHFGSTSDGYKAIPRYRVANDGTKEDNVTDFAVRHFNAHYANSETEHAITKDEIFNYTYAVLQDSLYRKVYEPELRREFPHIPLYGNFDQWRDWGQALIELHTKYTDVKTWPVKRRDTPSNRYAIKLKYDDKAGFIDIDSETKLTGIPIEAGDFKLGNRSAIQWALENWRPKKSRDKNVASLFPQFDFAPEKDAAIREVSRVVRVAVETARILAAMKAVPMLQRQQSNRRGI